MNKRIMRLITVSVLLCMLAVFSMVSADAATASIWFTDPTVTVGNDVSVVVDIKGDDIGGYEANISYDTSYLQFVSATGSSANFSHVNNTGVIRILDYMSSGSAAKLSCTLTFKTKKTGTTKLTPSGCMFTSGGGDDIAPYSIGDSTIKIIPVPEASSDATLKGITVSSGALTPAFSPTVTSYTASVDYSVSSIAVTALKNHEGASVYVSGTESLAIGENTVTITVTAENGDKKIYTIKVTRGKNPLSSGVYLTLAGGLSAEVSNTISADKIPKGFSITSVTLKNVKVDAVIYDEKAKPAVWLFENDKVAEGLYYVDLSNYSAQPFEYVGPTSNPMLFLDITLAAAPEGYQQGKFTVDGISRDVLIPSGTEAPNHCLVYAIGAAGRKMLYMYDPLEKTFQRFNFAELGEPEETTGPEETDVETLEPTPVTGEEKPVETYDFDDYDDETEAVEENGLFRGTFKWIFIVIGVLVVVLAAVAVILGIKQN